VDLTSILDRHPDDAPALIDGEEATTYGQLRELVSDTRAGLVAADLGPGDRVAIVCTNRRASVIAMLGAVTGGMVAVLLDPTNPVSEHQRQIDTVGARIVTTGTSLDGPLTVPIVSPAGTTVEGIDPLPDDQLAFMLFTSGTAGAPKAAMLSHGNLSSNQESIMSQPGADIDENAVVLAVLPLSHMYGLNIALLTTLRGGGTVVLQSRFDPATCLDLISRHGVNRFAGVPPMWRAFLDHEGIAADAFASVDRMTSGAAPLPPSLWHEFHDRFGIELSEGYGLTETSPTVTSHVGIPIRPGSVGKPIPGVEVVVVDHDGNPAPADDSGEVKVRGPNVFLGYWDDEEATKAVLDDDGWLSTRDIGVMTDDGYLYLVDRAKDLIIVRGFNVYPFEVEAVLNLHPAVDQTVVVGREDDQRGERVVAYVTLVEGADTPSLDDLVDFCRDQLARYKCPSELHVVDELPIAASGKRIRRELG